MVEIIFVWFFSTKKLVEKSHSINSPGRKEKERERENEHNRKRGRMEGANNPGTGESGQKGPVRGFKSGGEPGDSLRQ